MWKIYTSDWYPRWSECLSDLFKKQMYNNSQCKQQNKNIPTWIGIDCCPLYLCEYIVIGAPFGNNGAPPANTVRSQSMATVCTFGPNSSNVHLIVKVKR